MADFEAVFALAGPVANPLPDDEGFIALWPTLMLRQRLPGFEAANGILADWILARARQHKDLTTDYRAGNLLAETHPAIRWLAGCIQVSARQYMQRQGVRTDTPWSLQGWANVNRRGDYHGVHNHPHSYLSGTYYVAVPRQEALAEGRLDLAPGEISFLDPRPQANMTAIAGDAQIEAEYSLLPAAGDLLLWPAWLHHMVHPNASDEARISISFNIVLKRPTDHLPDQS